MVKRKAPTEFDVDRCLTELADVQEEVRMLVAGWPEEQCRARPDGNGWSALECVEHLAITAGAFLPVWDDAIAFGRSKGRLRAAPYRYPWLSRFFIRQLEPPVKFKVRTTEAFVPSSSLTSRGVLVRYLESHREVILRLNAVRGLDAVGITVTSPFSRWMKYPLGASFDLLLAHERRHAWQAARAVTAYARRTVGSR